MRTMVLDIGGTAIKSAVFENGSLLNIRETPTEARLGGAHVTQRAISIISDYQKVFSFGRIGISTAGQVNPETGTIIYANQNIPGYTGTELKAIMENTFQISTSVENDVNAAALGEAAFGAGQGEDDFACLTYGTGVGGAMVLRGELYHGSSFSAGEFGAIMTHPEEHRPEQDPFSGCYEKYASTTALVRRASRLDPALTNGRIIFERMEDPMVKTVIDGWIMEIVYGLATITHMMNPSCLVLGGGIMEQPYVLEQIQDRLYRSIMPSFRRVRVKKASLGNQAGMLGAATLADRRK
ncbi:MAG: ROK family protein [Lachnospiraceae bacterium]|nr:ROK family protein [Lachnospiraceae bacterium]